MCTFLAINTASIQLIHDGHRDSRHQWVEERHGDCASRFLATLIAACSARDLGVAVRAAAMFRLARCSLLHGLDDVDASPAETVDVEKVETTPLNSFKIWLLVVFVAAFVLMFILLAFPNWLPAFWTAPARPPENGGQGSHHPRALRRGDPRRSISALSSSRSTPRCAE
jgi:hypothetical protein